MRALRRTTKGRRPAAVTEKTKSVPAPTGGLNAVNAIAEMPPTDALVLDNIFCQPGWVEVRKGYTNFVTGFPGWVDTLAAYASATAQKLFALSGGNLYDASVSGLVGAPLLTGLPSSRYEGVQFATPGGNYLYLMCGNGAPLLYDGVTFKAITGVTAPIALSGPTSINKLRNPWVWKNRLWAIEDGTFTAWYLPIQSVGGVMLPLPLASYFTLGGQLQCGFEFSLSDANTTDDFIGFMSSFGEIVVFRGTDPAFQGSFGLAGAFQAGRPVGRRPYFKYGSDTILITTDGFNSVREVISSGRDKQNQALSYKILNLINNDTASYVGNFGWQGIVYPIGNKLIVNVPMISSSTQYQYVMNTITKSWSTFSNWNASCFEKLVDNLYFGGNTYVALADTGNTDGGAAISFKIKPAFNYFDSDRKKQFKMVRPIIAANGSQNISLQINVDFNDIAPSLPNAPSLSSGPFWDVALWDTVQWGGAEQIFQNWYSVNGLGFASTLYLTGSINGSTLKLQAIDYLYEVGDIL